MEPSQLNWIADLIFLAPTPLPPLATVADAPGMRVTGQTNASGIVAGLTYRGSDGCGEAMV